ADRRGKISIRPKLPVIFVHSFNSLPGSVKGKSLQPHLDRSYKKGRSFGKATSSESTAPIVQ
ncbi:MAG: hypothetical protein ABSA33_07385, partial [Candidatus Micrarchaeaceae archaeon]